MTVRIFVMSDRACKQMSCCFPLKLNNPLEFSTNFQKLHSLFTPVTVDSVIEWCYTFGLSVRTLSKSEILTFGKGEKT